MESSDSVAGMTERMEKGQTETTRRIAAQMKAAGEPVDKITRFTGLSQEEVEAI